MALTLTLARVVLHNVMHHSSTSTYTQISLKSNKLFVDGRTNVQTDGWTDVLTGGRTFETDCITSTRKSRPENGRNSDFQGLVTLILTLDRVILHNVIHHSSSSTYIPNFIEIEETFVDGRADVQTDERTDVRTDGHVRPALLGRIGGVHLKSKGFPYLLQSVGPGDDPGVQAVSPQVTISHPPGGRLPLLTARQVTLPAAKHHRPLAGTKLYCLVTGLHKREQLAQSCYAAFAPSRI